MKNLSFRPRRILLPLLLACAPLFLAGCTHHLEIANIPDNPFFLTARTEPLSIGLVNKSSAADTDAYVASVARSLQKSGSFSKVTFPYMAGQQVDVVAHVDVLPTYRGSAANFFVDFPGFFLFAPTWHGYNYHSDLKTRVELSSRSDGQPIGGFEWQYDYHFKHAEIARSWYGIIPIIGGLLHTSYDPNQTQAFITEVGNSYGNQIATRIGQQLGMFQPAGGGR